MATEMVRWVCAGIRKVLLPARGAHCMAPGADGRLALTMCGATSVLRVADVGPAVASFGGSGTVSDVCLGALVLHDAAGLPSPSHVYPAAAGHEFVCHMLRGVPNCAAEHPPMQTTAWAAEAVSSINDALAVAWAPISRGPALLLVGGQGRLFLVRPRTVPLARRYRPMPDVQPPIKAVESASPMSNLPERPGESDSQLAGEAGVVSYSESKTPVADNSAQLHARSGVGNLLYSRENCASPSARGGFDVDVAGYKMWELRNFSIEEEGECHPLAQKGVRCAASVSLHRMGTSASRGWPQAGSRVTEYEDVILAVGSESCLTLWLWPDEDMLAAELVGKPLTGWVSSVAWCRVPCAPVSGLEDSALLAVALNDRLCVLNVGFGAVGRRKAALLFDMVWESSPVVPRLGVDSVLAWNYSTIAGDSDYSSRKQNTLSDVGQVRTTPGPRFVLQLGFGALCLLSVFRWETSLCPASEFSKRGPDMNWSIRLSPEKALQCEQRPGIVWSNVYVASAFGEFRHERVITGLSFLNCGSLVSSSEDGSVVVWGHGEHLHPSVLGSQAMGEGGISGDDLGEGMLRCASVLPGNLDKPAFGLCTLQCGLCVATLVAVPATDEAILKSRSKLLSKFSSGVRLGRVAIMAPIASGESGCRESLYRAVEALLASGLSGGAVVGWDLDVWMRNQSEDMRIFAMKILWSIVGAIQEQACGLDEPATVISARAMYAIAGTIVQFGSELGLMDLVSEAVEFQKDMFDVLMFLHCCFVVPRVHEYLCSGSSIVSEEKILALSRLERISIYATCLHVSSASDESQDDFNDRGPLMYSRAILEAMNSLMDKEQLAIQCPVCELEGNLRSIYLCPADGNGHVLSCPDGDGFVLCALSRLPCIEPVSLACTGCRVTTASVALMRDDACVAGSEFPEGSHRSFAWLESQRECPVCGCSYQISL